MIRTTRTDVVVSPIVQSMLDKLSSPELRDFGSSWEVGFELAELRKTLQTIQAMLGFMEELQVRDELVKVLLRDLRGVAYYVDDALDEFIYEVLKERDERSQGRKKKPVRSLFLSFLNTHNACSPDVASFITKIDEKLADIEKKLQPHYLGGSSTVKHSGMLNSQNRQGAIHFRDIRQMSSSLVGESYIFGRKEEAYYVKNVLLSNQYDGREVPVVSIVGMGGLGKTKLAQLIYNDPEIKEHFNMRWWICVSVDFTVDRLTRAILELETRKTGDLKELESLQLELQDRVREQRFLLVLDDVWSENRDIWDALRLPFCAADKGSRIIVTSRSQRVSSIMGSVKTLSLGGLSNEDCWTLFKNKAFIDENSDAHPFLEAIGKKIVHKCNGVPLLISTLGELLYGELDEKKWEYILKGQVLDLEENKIFSTLSSSYHHLPAHLKICFQYCSLFPKDYEFEKEILVLLWMAEGFLPSNEIEKMEDIGIQYFDDLLHRSFFQKIYTLIDQTSEERFVMHELMHDVSQSVSREICFSPAFVKPCDKLNSENARHMSLINDDLDSVNKELYDCKGTSTFLLPDYDFNIFFFGEVTHEFFEGFRCLRVLDLKGYEPMRLPDSIGNLKHLRYLNLSYSGIRELPESTCNLFNLQTLVLKNCLFFSRLPTNIESLIHLRHIMMEGTAIRSTPVGIGRLRFLQTFPPIFLSQDDGFRIRDLKEFQYLKGELHIYNLENVASGMEAMEADLKHKQNIDHLLLKWSDRTQNLRDEDDIRAVLEGLQPHTTIKSLKIIGYKSLVFPNWMMMELSVYNKLVSLTLSNCKKCKFLPPLGQLPALESLEIDGLVEVKCVSHEFYGDKNMDGSKKGFQKLKFLTFKEMDGLEEWYGSEEGEFPCLKELVIKCCRKLSKLPPLLPTVKELEIYSCDALTSLPRLQSVFKLRLGNCDETILSWMHHCTSLSSLDISNFRNPTSLPPAMLRPLAASLQNLQINDFPRLRLLTEDVGLQDLASLQYLEISGCDNLMSLPKGFHKLSSLEYLTIGDCDQFTSFSEEENDDGRGGGMTYPPMLKRLQIYSCNNLKYLPRGLHNLTSLMELTIDRCDRIMLFLDQEGSLPPMLKRLSLGGFDQLKTLPRGLHNLNSLQELQISDCNSITSLLDEGLPSSLCSLTIWRCPEKLKSRLNREGEDWPKIAHIQNVSFYG
nr:TPA_asm: hypothetical protein HUJ06_006411 [Nelumbo nucifera]